MVEGTRHICVCCSYDLDADVFGAAVNLNEKIGETVPHRPYKKAETERFLCGFRELSTKLYVYV